MALAAFTMLHGATLQPKDVYGSVYSKCILWGLTFSAAGDVFLVRTIQISYSDVGESFQSKTRVERGKMVSGVKWVTQLFIMAKLIET